MDELLEVILESIAGHEDHVVIDKQENSHFIAYKVRVHPDDVGKLIGKGGSMANAIRTILKTAVVKLAQSKKITFEVVQDDAFAEPEEELANWNPKDT